MYLFYMYQHRFRVSCSQLFISGQKIFRSSLHIFKVFYTHFSNFIYQWSLLQANILYIFIVFVVIFLWHVKFKSWSSNGRRRRSTSLRLAQCCPLMGQFILFLYNLLDITISHWKTYVIVSGECSPIYTCWLTREVARSLTMTFTGTPLRSRTLPTVLVTTRSQKVPPATLFVPAALSILICPHAPIPAPRSHSIHVRLTPYLVHTSPRCLLTWIRANVWHPVYIY
jgi:hypothetical protein